MYCLKKMQRKCKPANGSSCGSFVKAAVLPNCMAIKHFGAMNFLKQGSAFVPAGRK
jgi:hypothetical protein